MPSRYGIKSRQLARSGEASGAVITLKSMAPSALVRMNISSPRSLTEYCTPSSRDHAEPAAGTFMQMGEPAGIGFFVNQHVVRLLRSQAMTPDLHRTMIVVEIDIEEALRVC